MTRDRIVTATMMLVRIALVLNVLLGVATILALLASFVAYGPIAAHLLAKYPTGVDIAALIWTVRGLALLSLVAVAIARRVFRELQAVLGSLRAGDPFDPANAGRITAIAWALLAWQLLELATGAVNWWVGRLGADHATWLPSFGGWLAVLVAFVLARVFAAGSRMRDELAATI